MNRGVPPDGAEGADRRVHPTGDDALGAVEQLGGDRGQSDTSSSLAKRIPPLRSVRVGASGRRCVRSSGRPIVGASGRRGVRSLGASGSAGRQGVSSRRMTTRADGVQPDLARGRGSRRARAWGRRTRRTRGRVERAVPRHVGERRQDDGRVAGVARPRAGVFEQRGADALPHRAGQHRDLLDVGQPVDLAAARGTPTGGSPTTNTAERVLELVGGERERRAGRSRPAGTRPRPGRRCRPAAAGRPRSARTDLGVTRRPVARRRPSAVSQLGAPGGSGRRRRGRRRADGDALGAGAACPSASRAPAGRCGGVGTTGDDPDDLAAHAASPRPPTARRR